jgi:hypothetical protein
MYISIKFSKTIIMTKATSAADEVAARGGFIASLLIRAAFGVSRSAASCGRIAAVYKDPPPPPDCLRSKTHKMPSTGRRAVSSGVSITCYPTTFISPCTLSSAKVLDAVRAKAEAAATKPASSTLIGSYGVLNLIGGLWSLYTKISGRRRDNAGVRQRGDGTYYKGIIAVV